MNKPYDVEPPVRSELDKLCGNVLQRFSYISVEHIPGSRKSFAVWGKSEETNTLTPLMYFRKSKYISESDLRDLISVTQVNGSPLTVLAGEIQKQYTSGDRYRMEKDIEFLEEMTGYMENGRKDMVLQMLGDWIHELKGKTEKLKKENI